MRLFRREAAPPKDFWTWWSTTADRLAASIDAGNGGAEFAGEITAAVRTINRDLTWELAPGLTARHAFCVTPEGRADLRPAAIRWLGSAPPADETWEFHASRLPARNLAGVQLNLGGAVIALAEMSSVSSWDSSRRRVDVQLWHPQFPHLTREARLQAAFLFLDNLLGEDDVERWIGTVDLLDAPLTGKTPRELLTEVDRHRTEPVSDDSWVIGQVDGADGPAIVVANAALKRIDHPLAGIHVTVRMAIPGGGMPSDADAERLNEEEDQLVEGFKAIGAYAGRTTRPGVRTLHFVAPSVDDTKRVIDAWAEALPTLAESRQLKVGFEEDVHWRFRQLDLGV